MGLQPAFLTINLFYFMLLNFWVGAQIQYFHRSLDDQQSPPCWTHADLVFLDLEFNDVITCWKYHDKYPSSFGFLIMILLFFLSCFYISSLFSCILCFFVLFASCFKSLVFRFLFRLSFSLSRLVF